MKSLDKLKEEKIAVKRENQPGHWIQQKAEIGVAQEKQMEVCDVCGAFLIVNDVQQRVEDHLMGKQHVGYGRLKAALDELLEKRSQEASVPLEEAARNQSRSSTTGDGQRNKDSNQRGHHHSSSSNSSSTSRPVFRDHRSRDHKGNSNSSKRHRSRSPTSSSTSKSHRRSDDRNRANSYSSSSYSRSASSSSVNGSRAK